jgi:hypothetical protein
MKLTDEQIMKLIETQQHIAKHAPFPMQQMNAEAVIHALTDYLRLRKAALVEAGK